MVPLTSLWLPILISAVIFWLAGFIAWQILPHHRSDYRKLPDEEGFRAALRQQNPPPGQYTFPHVAKPQEAKSPEWQKKMAEGPSGFLVVLPPGPQPLGKNLILYFLYGVAVAFLVAYLTGRTLAPGAPYLEVFRVAGTAAILAYSGALPVRSIWFGRTWSSTFKEILDGVVFGLLTAGVFGWLWP